MEGAKDLHVTELSVTIEVLVLLLVPRLLVLYEKVLYCQRHTGNFLSDVLLCLARDYVAVEEVLWNGIDAVLDWSDIYLLLHAFFVLCVDPEWQAKVNRVVHVHHRVLSKLKLANEPFQVYDPLNVLVESDKLGKSGLAKVKGFFVVKSWVAKLIDLAFYGKKFRLVFILGFPFILGLAFPLFFSFCPTLSFSFIFRFFA